MKFTVVCLAVIGMAGVVLPVYAQGAAEQKAISVLGEVVSADLVKSEVLVKQLKDAVTNTYENTTFVVLPETKIAKGDVALKLSDLKAGDKVIVKYTTDALGKQKVENISVEVK